MLIYKNESEIKFFKAKMQEGQKIATTIVSEFNNLPFTDITKLEQLKALIHDPQAYMIDALTVPEQKLFGVTLSKQKVFNLMDIDTEPLLTLIKEHDQMALSCFLEVGKVVSGSFEVDTKLLDKVLERYEIHAVTSKEKQVAEALLMAIDGIQRMIDLGMINKDFLQNHKITSWIRQADNKLFINPSFFAQHSR